MKMDTSYVAERIKCSREEKIKCAKTVKKIIWLSNIARKEGILALEVEVNDESNELIKIAGNLICDGTDPSIIRDIMENYIISGDYRERKFLEAMIIMEGMLSIQDGQNPMTIKERLKSYFGVEFRSIFEEWNKNEEEDIKINLGFRCKYIGKEPYSEKTKLLDECIDIDNRSIQRILRDIDNNTLAFALIGSRFKVIETFLSNVSRRMEKLIVEDMSCINIDKIEESIIINAQKEILRIISYLEKSGEIVIISKKFLKEALDKMIDK